MELNRGSSSVDRALAFQAKGREFESRLPLNNNQQYAFNVFAGFFVFQIFLPASVSSASHFIPVNFPFYRRLMRKSRRILIIKIIFIL